jgi:hypothetical protein
MNAIALKAPAQSYKLPAWATPHNIVTAAVVAGALLAIILLARAVGRLAKLARVAAAPVASPKFSGGYGKLLLAAAAGIGGLVLYERHQNAAAPAKAAPAPMPTPTPTPTPHPTVTQVVAPHVAPHLTFPIHLTGGDIVAMWIIGGVVAIVIFLNSRRGGDS